MDIDKKYPYGFIVRNGELAKLLDVAYELLFDIYGRVKGISTFGTMLLHGVNQIQIVTFLSDLARQHF